MKITVPRAIVIAVMAVAGFGINSASANQADKPEAQTAPRPVLSVNTIQASVQNIPLTLTANGSVAAWHEAIVGAEVSGLRLAEVRVQVGDAVKKGQVLAVFADESVQADVAQARALLAETEATLADAHINAGRARQVSGSGALSAEQIAQYLTAEKAAQAKVQSAKAQLDAQLLRQRYTRVVASDDGTISSRSAALGAVAAQGQELFRLIRQNRLEWRAEVVANELPKIRPGVEVQLQAPGVGGVRGKVRTIAPTVDTQTRNALVYVDVPDAIRQGLRPGMFASGEFRLGSSQGLSVPQDALSQREGFNYLFRLGAVEGDRARVTQIKVQPGRRIDGRVEILTGLNPGDRLVASGGAFLADGDIVKVLP
jgi:RND family efflux transporter MFP subunit